RIAQAISVDHERVIETCATRVARPAQRFRLIEETKCARRRDLTPERVVVEAAFECLPPNKRAGKLDLKKKFRSLSGQQLHIRSRIAHCDRFFNADHLP